MAETVFYNNKNLVGVGSVGIGTTSPKYILDVTGNARTGNTGAQVNTFTMTPWNDDGKNTVLQNDNGMFTINSQNDINFYSNTTYVSNKPPVYDTQIMTLKQNGNVGIGTPTPAYLLQLYKSYALSGSTTFNIFTNSGTSSNVARSDYSIVSQLNPYSIITSYNFAGAGATYQYLPLYLQGSPTIFTAGNVGIGTTNPLTDCEIYTSEPTLSVRTSNTSVSNASCGTLLLQQQNQTGGKFVYDGAADALIIKCLAGGGVDTTNGPIISLRNVPGGGVGVGTASPYGKFDVIGSITSSNATTASHGVITMGNGEFLTIEASNSGNTGKLPVNINAYGGNVGIGLANPGFTLDVAGTLRSSGAVVFSQSINSPTCVIGASSGGNNAQTGILQVVGRANAYLAIGTSMDGTNGQTHIQFNNTNGVVGSIVTNGTATTYITVSDYRLKSNIVPMTDGLEVINKLDPVYFTFNNDPSEVCSGFIAHVLQEVIPNAVSGEKDAVNDDGTNKYQGVDSSFIVSFLVSAIQELSVKNTDLEAKLETAQNDIDLLESRLAAIEALISTNTSADTGSAPTTGTRAEALLSQV